MPPTKGWRLGVNHTFMGQPPPLLVAWQREGEGEGSGPLCSDNPPPSPIHEETAHLHKGHIHLVHIRPLLPVNLHADEVLTEQAANLLVLEGFLLHHVAPVTGGVPHWNGAMVGRGGGGYQ